MNAPLIVTVAPNGARRSKADHPQLPISADEIAATAAACCAAGAAMIHVHVRDRAGAHSLDADAYRAATAAIRRAVGDRLIVQVTTEAVGRYGPAEQMAMVRAVEPEAVSLALRELLPGGAADADAAAFFAWLAEKRILAQYILYEPAEVAQLCRLIDRRVLPAPPSLLFVLGSYRERRAGLPRDLLPFLAALGDRPALWAVCAFGAHEAACVMAAAALGGHCRVGFENNLQLADGSVAPDNAALVAQTVRGATLLGRPVAGADSARRMMYAEDNQSRYK